MRPVFLVLLALRFSLVCADTFIPAASPLIRWSGRPNPQPDGSVGFDWASTSCTFTVSGIGATVSLLANVTLPPASAGRIAVMINDYDAQNLLLHASSSEYLIAASLAFPLNTVTVFFAEETVMSGASRPAGHLVSFLGFRVGGGGALGQAPALPRRVDFVGDSITAGSGYDRLEAVNGPLSLGTGCHPWAPTAGNSQFYNWQTYASRALRLNFSTTAWSGKGLIFNSGCSAGPTMPELYTQAFSTDPAAAWDFSRATRPDAIVVYLGTNDYSCPQTTDAAFSSALVDFFVNATRLYSASPGPASTTFFAAIGPMSPTKPAAAIAAALAAAKAQGLRAELLDLRGNASAPVALDGCGGHPGPFGHWTMATLAVPQIRAAMGW